MTDPRLLSDAEIDAIREENTALPRWAQKNINALLDHIAALTEERDKAKRRAMLNSDIYTCDPDPGVGGRRKR